MRITDNLAFRRSASWRIKAEFASREKTRWGENWISSLNLNWFSLPHPFAKILSNDEDEKFEEMMANLQQDDTARVIVCFCEGMTVRGMLKAIKSLNMTNRFLIIGSDGWADRQDVVSDYELQAVGSISIRIHSPSLKSFDDYYFALNPFENHRNPWFREFWEDKFHCKMPLERAPTTTAQSTVIDSSSTAEAETDLPTMTTLSSATTQIPFCTGNWNFTVKIKVRPLNPTTATSMMVTTMTQPLYERDEHDVMDYKARHIFIQRKGV